MPLVTHTGSCHCGAVRFEVVAPPDIAAVRCNCSVCRKTGFLHLIVAKDAFRITAGEDQLTEYRFHTKTARHLFCRTCGVKAFYVPRSHPDGWSVNVHCLEPDTLGTVGITEFDGEHWETSIDRLRESCD